MSRKSSKRKHTVHWFRKGLRLSDNPALLRGIRRCETFRCVFILDPWFAGSSNVGTNKWRSYNKCFFQCFGSESARSITLILKATEEKSRIRIRNSLEWIRSTNK